MAKSLIGSELASFVKQRQAKQVRMLRQAHGIAPRLVIIKSQRASDVINTYVRIKQRYASDILIDVDVVACEQAAMAGAIEAANADPTVHGIVVQLPLDEPDATDEIVALVDPTKDVDGLGPQAVFGSATAEAIDWLLIGHDINLSDAAIVILGRGRLVGRSLEQLWQARGWHVQAYDRRHRPSDDELCKADVIVSATGAAHSLTSAQVGANAVVVDAGTASEDGAIVGDIADELYERRDISLTPRKGGVGPLTVTLLFEHVIQAALQRASKKSEP